MSYATLIQKKFLDANGLAYFSRKLNNYPTNDLLAAVINGIQDELDEKQDKILYGTTAEWRSKLSYIPAEGEVIIYTDKSSYVDENENTVYIPGIKIGDGQAYGIDLPFVGDDIVRALAEHARNTDIHTTAEEKAFWNNKLNCLYAEETLTLNRN